MKLFLCFLCFLPLLLPAQANLAGTVIDSFGTSLPGANIVLVKASDSLLVSFGSTDNLGRFQLKDIAPGNYLLRCSFLGYRRPEQRVEITEEDQLLHLGELKMYPEGFLLDGIEVNGYRIPIRMRGDTMVFDADAFGSGPNAVVEDLLRRLPGMRIEPNGAILYHGKPVNEVMVNGKPFFRGNSQIITQNLDAAAVENVEVYDRKTDTEVVSGVNDGRENMTVNLTIKEEAKNKPFGQLYAGAGTANRYLAGGKAFRIGDRSQLGLLGLFNNVNRTGFSPSTAMGWGSGSVFGGGNNGSDGQLPVSWRGQNDGDNQTITGGLNYGTSIGKRSNLSAAYILSDRNQLLNEQQTDVFSGALTGRRTELERINQSQVYSHRLTLDFDTKADTISNFRADIALFLTGRENDQQANGTIQTAAGESSTYDQQDTYDQQAPTITGSATYTRRLGKPGRTLSFNQQLRRGRPERILTSQTTGLLPINLPGFSSNGNSRQNFNEEQFLSTTTLTFTEPLTNDWRWRHTGNYDLQQRNTQSNFLTSQDNTDNFSLENQQRKLSYSTSLLKKFGKNNFSFGGKIHLLDWQLGGDIDRSETYRWFAPDLQLVLMGKKMSLNIFVNGAPEVPENHQLQAIVDPQAVTNIRLGNPNLTPAFRYSFSTFTRYSDEFAGFSASLNGSSSYVDNVLGEDLSFIDGRPLYINQNLSHQWQQSFNFRVDQRLDLIEANIGISSNVNLTSGPGSFEGMPVDNNFAGYGFGITLTKTLNDDSFLRIGYNRGFTRQFFNTGENTIIKTDYHNLNTAFQLEMNEHWRLETDFGLTSFGGAAFALPTTLLLWSLNLEIRPFKKQPHYFTITGHDLLNQNRNVSRTAEAFYTRSSTTNSLGRYGMVSFHWKL